MKRALIVSLAAIWICAGSPALAELPPPVASGVGTPADAGSSRDQTITTNPLGLATGSLSLEYERAGGKALSWFAGPSFAYASAQSGASSISLFGFGATAGARLFFAELAPKGLWIGPQGSLIYISGSFGSGESVSAAAYSLGGLLGYTWIFDSGFVLSLGGGVQYLNMKLDSSSGQSVGLSGVLPAVRLSLGYGF